MIAVESGRCNGPASKPSYEQICSGTTGHAEVVRVSFGPGRITLRRVLEIFFVIHDPTTLKVPAQVNALHRGRAVISCPFARIHLASSAH